MKKERKHQRDAIAANIKGFKRHDRLQNIMACGSGKTLVAIRTAARMNAKRILVAVPSLMLLSQATYEWSKEFGNTFDHICVCSDKTVDAEDLSYCVTTDKDEVKSFLRKKTSVKIVFCTYQSLDVLSSIKITAFDLFISDEAHRTACSPEGLFSTGLHNDSIPAKKRLFMTATRRIFKGESREHVHSMCDEDIYGPVVYSLNFGQAIKRKLLCDYKIVVAGIDEKAFNEYRKHFPTKIDGVPLKNADHLAKHVMILKTIKEYGLKRIISFHSRVRGSEQFASDLLRIEEWIPRKLRIGKIMTAHVDGHQKASERAESLSRYNSYSDISVLTNARCLTEGVDLPSTDAIIFTDPRYSHIDIIQSFGRALRLDPDNKNKTGVVIIPVMVPEGTDANDYFKGSQYKAIWNVIEALSSVDERLAKSLEYHKHTPQCKMTMTNASCEGSIGDIVTAIDHVKDHDAGDGTREEHDWKKYIHFKVPARFNNNFCQALWTKTVHPEWSKIWLGRDQAIDYCVKNKIGGPKELSKWRKLKNERL